MSTKLRGDIGGGQSSTGYLGGPLFFVRGSSVSAFFLGGGGFSGAGGGFGFLLGAGLGCGVMVQ